MRPAADLRGFLRDQLVRQFLMTDEWFRDYVSRGYLMEFAPGFDETLPAYWVAQSGEKADGSSQLVVLYNRESRAEPARNHLYH